MNEPNKSADQTRRDLLAISTQGLFVCGCVFPAMYGVYRAWLSLTGVRPDDPISVPVALLFGLTIIASIPISGTVAGLLWVLVMRGLLSRAEMEKWLNKGVGSATLRRWNARILDRAYRSRPERSKSGQ